MPFCGLPAVTADTLVLTDPNKAYRAFYEEPGIAHDFVNMRAGQRAIRHNRDGERSLVTPRSHFGLNIPADS